ncbi:hypothetical protein [Streptomyces sp. NBC_01483]|uniref:hypothetical protein n=1 Tax=Streptomyces sp. NBC_01483 TaxID=2903883 RepID=UPI002E2EA786|nr:hypothetical protein [Streptomyces sp. NBC_01483]
MPGRTACSTASAGSPRPYVAATSNRSWSAAAISFAAATPDARLSAEASDCRRPMFLPRSVSHLCSSVDACTEIDIPAFRREITSRAFRGRHSAVRDGIRRGLQAGVRSGTDQFIREDAHDT